MKYRKKPVVIDAIHLTADLLQLELAAFLGADRQKTERSGTSLLIHTLEGTMEASLNDWIIRGVKGELYPCKPDIFAATYEPVE